MYDGAAMWGRLLLFAMLAVPMSAAHVSQAPAGAASQSAEEHLSLAKRYLAEQKTDLAIAELKQAVALDPANVEARGNLGVLLYFRGDYAGAVSNLRTALNAQPDLWKIQALLGMAENRAGDRQASRNDLETAFPHLTDAKVQLDAGEVLADLYSNDGNSRRLRASFPRCSPHAQETLRCSISRIASIPTWRIEPFWRWPSPIPAALE